MSAPWAGTGRSGATLRASAAGCLAAAALAFAPMTAARADGPPERTPSGEEIPELVWIVAVEGAPSDSALRAAFDRGFKLGLDESLLRTERRAGRRGHEPSRPIRNRFRQVFGTTGEGAWQLQASIEGAPRVPDGHPRDPSPPRPSADVVLVIHSPAMVAANARPLPVRWRLVSSAPAESAADWTRSLGRAVALLALEHMHHLQETLPEGDRLVIEGFERVRPAAAEGPTRR